MLASIDLNFFAGDLACGFRAKKEHDLRDLVRVPTRCIGMFGASRDRSRREDFRLDFAGRDRVYANAVRRQVMGHLAGETSERSLRSRVGSPGKRMDPRADDRGDVDHRAAAGLERVEQAARQQDGREKIDVDTVIQV